MADVVESMNALDWSVVVVYLASMIALALWLGRKQENDKDYFLGGNSLPWWSIGISVMATQASTNSLLGTPAVIAQRGLTWLQLEFSLPLATIVIMMVLLPFYRRLEIVSVYEYLERRFGIVVRTMISVMFQFSRAFATGVTVLGITKVLEVITGLSFTACVAILTVFTCIYDMLGGIKGVVVSDVIQMLILWFGVFVCIVYAVVDSGGWVRVFELYPGMGAVTNSSDFVGFKTLDFASDGLGNGSEYGFFPTLLGGLFLLTAYYGTDQTQVQRMMASKDCDDTNRSLMLNGLLRFSSACLPVLLGICISAYIVQFPEFLDLCRQDANGPEAEVNYNLLVPIFVMAKLPHGIIGLVMVALFSAAMSSIDSTINSLSAVTTKDVVERFITNGPLEPERQLRLSQFLTVVWGLLIGAFSYLVDGLADSVVVAVNRVSSFSNGPILGVFALGILVPSASNRGALVGLIAGVVGNTLIALFAPWVQWLWWNFTGFVITFCGGWLASMFLQGLPDIAPELVWSGDAVSAFKYKVRWPLRYAYLVLYTLLMIGYCMVLQRGLFDSALVLSTIALLLSICLGLFLAGKNSPSLMHNQSKSSGELLEDSLGKGVEMDHC